MAVTSDQLLAFVKDMASEKTDLDQDGNIVLHRGAFLHGLPLAKAVKTLADLAMHERGLAFAENQWTQQMGLVQQPPPFGPLRPVN